MTEERTSEIASGLVGEHAASNPNCTCGPEYLDRGLDAPDCPLDYVWEAVWKLVDRPDDLLYRIGMKPKTLHTNIRMRSYGDGDYDAVWDDVEAWVWGADDA